MLTTIRLCPRCGSLPAKQYCYTYDDRHVLQNYCAKCKDCYNRLRPRPAPVIEWCDPPKIEPRETLDWITRLVGEIERRNAKRNYRQRRREATERLRNAPPSREW